jgi:membrane-associated protease RseP (regulator of RpoE activity)
MSELADSPATLEQADALRQEMVGLFVEESMTLDWPELGHIRYRGRFINDLAGCYDSLRERFERHGFTPIIREEDGASLVAVPVIFDPKPSRWTINLVLLLATILSTLYLGAVIEYEILNLEGIPGIGNLLLGIPYCLSIMAILGAHEMGHYFAARYHKAPVSLPYFIPLPFISPFGTLGAFIRLKAPLKNKRALLDVGAAGPLAGLVVAIPLLIYGLSISTIEPLPTVEYSLEGNSILYALLKLLINGQMYPTGTEDVFLGQIAWAGWVGLFVTGFNLIPVGQLDGGHIAYALFGRRARLLFWPVIVGLIAVMIITQTLSWILLVVLLFILGRVYAEPLDDITPLDDRRKWVAIISLILFPLVFVPIPLQFITP